MCFLGCNLFGLYGYTLGEIYGRMKVFLELIKSEEFLGARTLLWGQLRILLRRLGPTR